MTTSRLLRRPAAIVAGLGAVAALALVPAGSANAKIAGGIFAEAQSDVEYTGSGSGDCNLTTPSGSDANVSHMKVIKKSATVHRAVAINAQYTNSLVATDKVRVKGSYRSTTVVKKHKLDLESVRVTGKGKLAITHTQPGSDCSATGEAYGVATVEFTEHKAGHLVLTRATNVKSALSVAVVYNLKTKQELTFDLFQGGQSHAVSKVALKPGKYELVAETGISVGAGGGLLKHSSPTKTAKLTSGLDFTFVPKKK